MKVRALIPLFIPPPVNQHFPEGHVFEIADWQAQQWIHLGRAEPVTEQPATSQPQSVIPTLRPVIPTVEPKTTEQPENAVAPKRRGRKPKVKQESTSEFDTDLL